MYKRSKEQADLKKGLGDGKGIKEGEGRIKRVGKANRTQGGKNEVKGIKVKVKK